MPYAPDLSGCALDGRYELHVVIGEGAFGRVYSGRDRRLERPVAIKLIKPWWAEDREWVRSFEREAQLLRTGVTVSVREVPGAAEMKRLSVTESAPPVAGIAQVERSKRMYV